MIMPVAKRLFALTFTQHFAGDRLNRRLSEWHMAGVMLSCGLTLMSSADMFGTLASYEVVSRIASQGVWAAFMVLLGAARLTALVVNGHFPRATGHARYLLASLSACTWALLLAGFMAFNSPLMIVSFLSGAVVVDLISAFRAAQAARQADDTREEHNGPRPG